LQNNQNRGALILRAENILFEPDTGNADVGKQKLASCPKGKKKNISQLFFNQP